MRNEHKNQNQSVWCRELHEFQHNDYQKSIKFIRCYTSGYVVNTNTNTNNVYNG
jgi:hypothetical protein